MSTSENPNKRAIKALKEVEGNDVCADCGQKGKYLDAALVPDCWSRRELAKVNIKLVLSGHGPLSRLLSH